MLEMELQHGAVAFAGDAHAVGVALGQVPAKRFTILKTFLPPMRA